MSVAIVTGSAGLIGSECVRFLADKGFDLVGIDNDMREYFYGPEGSTQAVADALVRDVKNYTHYPFDIRADEDLHRIFVSLKRNIAAVIHCASQPSHDWAVRAPREDFAINATGTLNVLDETRNHCPDAAFIFTSTSKVYGDWPNNYLPLIDWGKRLDLPDTSPMWKGIPENAPIDQSLHSLFGVSKASADLLVQEYGRYFGMKTVCFRPGCLTGPGHQGVPLHGFLSYLVKCCVKGIPYHVIGYKGKQVRDNIHSYDLVNAFWEFIQAPRSAEVYNFGGGRARSCSILEAIEIIERLSGKTLEWDYEDTPRIGDHKFFIGDPTKFLSHYPNYTWKYSLEEMLQEMVDADRHNSREE